MRTLSAPPSSTLLALRALGHASRLAAYRALVQAGPDGLAVGALREDLDLPPATLSAHLNVLRAAGLVTDAREGRVIRLRADYARMNALIGYLTENCCAGVPCGPDPVCMPASANPSRTRRPRATS
jgi:DNA-binding transcriptional ArsR family regulator